jgi:hypothetical protein
MARDIYIIKPEIMKGYILYDGPVTGKHRKEYLSLDSLVNEIPKSLQHFKPNKKLNVYTKGMSSEELTYMRKKLCEKLPNAKYIFDN